jgi:alpha-beta hydrolase superfamily lysophospholipase
MLLRHGGGSPLTVLVLPALFEEANRMRRFTVSLMRALATRGIGTLLPDLPGTGESLTRLADVSLPDWQDAVTELMASVRRDDGRCLTVAIRGGAILDAPADHGWRLASESGERVLRDLVRATALSSGISATELDRLARAEATTLAGQTLSPDLYGALVSTQVSTTNRRTARLTDDAGHSDVSLSGSRLWRNAEPGDDPDFVQAVASDIAEWAVTCAAH